MGWWWRSLKPGLLMWSEICNAFFVFRFIKEKLNTFTNWCEACEARFETVSFIKVEIFCTLKTSTRISFLSVPFIKAVNSTLEMMIKDKCWRKKWLVYHDSTLDAQKNRKENSAMTLIITTQGRLSELGNEPCTVPPGLQSLHHSLYLAATNSCYQK